MVGRLRELTCQRHRPRQESSKNPSSVSTKAVVIQHRPVLSHQQKDHHDEERHPYRDCRHDARRCHPRFGGRSHRRTRHRAHQRCPARCCPAAQPRPAPLNDPNGLCGFHDADGNCSVGAGAPSIIIDLKFPANTPQEQSIVDYLNKVLDDFNANTEPGTLDNPRPLQELDATSTTYTSGTPEAGTQTVVVEVSEHLGGLYPLTWYKAFTYNNAAKAPITFDTLFRPGTKPLDAILPIVQQHLSATAGQPMEDGLDARQLPELRGHQRRRHLLLRPEPDGPGLRRHRGIGTA